MWLFLSAIIICLTIMVMFRLYIDLRRQEQQFRRVMASDSRDYERYVAVTSRPVSKPALPDFSAAVEQSSFGYWEGNELPSQPSLEQLREAEQMVRYKSARIDPRLLNEAQLKYLQAMNDRRTL